MRSLLCCAALCLAFLATGRVAAADAVGMIVDLVRHDELDFRAIGLDRIRYDAKGEAATRQFASLLASQPPARQVELLRALADRGDKAALPAITSLLAAAKEPTARAAAVDALGMLGGGADAALLKQSLAAGDPERSAARRALTVLRGDDAVNQLVELARSGDPGLRSVAIEILAERRIRGITSWRISSPTSRPARLRP